MHNPTPESAPLKQCTICKQDKPATNEHFAFSKQTKDGLRGHCKICVKLRYGNPGKKAEYDRQYRAENQERIRERKKADYHANVETIRQKRRERYAETRDAINQRRNERFRQRYQTDPDFRQRWLESGRTYKREHPESWKSYYKKNAAKIKERARAWQEAHPERSRQRKRKWKVDNIDHARALSRAKEHRRRARKQRAQGTHTIDDEQCQYKAQKGKCYYCGVKVGKNYHIDHVIPLSRGGSNGPENIVIACPTCNQSKGDQLPHEWSRGNRLL